jgi:hypothetical protein
MKIYKFNEMMENEFDFYKSTYIESDKSVVGAYFISNIDDLSIEIINIQENEISDRVFMSGKSPYWINPNIIKFGISQIEILSDVESKPGYKFVKIPYFLFKRNKGLEIKRLKIVKNMSYTKYQLNKDFLTKIQNPKVKECFEVTATELEISNYERISKVISNHLNQN